MENAQTTTDPNPSPEPLSLDKLAHDIGGHIFAMSNALELIRLTAGDNPTVAHALTMLERQSNALIDLASKLSVVAAAK